MEAKTKIILGVLAVGTIAYLTRDKWMPKATSSDSENKSDIKGVKGYSISNKPKPCITAKNLHGGSSIINQPCWSDRTGCNGC